MRIRIGTLYRYELIKYFNRHMIDGPVLDVGCNDCFILRNIKAPIKIGIDLEINNINNGQLFVIADVNYLPFSNNVFEHIFALDVVEHLENDTLISKSLNRVLRNDGTILLTTPNKSIKLFPWFLTNYISKKWGHIYRNGYQINELCELFLDDFDLSIYEWNAFYWRTFYIIIRLIAELSISLTSFLIQQIFILDSHLKQGNKGYLVLEGRKYR